MRIVVVPDKFKGTLSASQAAGAMANGARSAAPSAEIVVVPTSDGGEGFSSALLAGRGGESQNAVVTGPLGAPIAAHLAYLGGGRVALESASACSLGLLRVPDPLGASSTGVGDLVRHALAELPSVIVVGVGGTASTDGGTGAAAALGWRFLDAHGVELPPGGGALERLHSLDGARVDARLEGRSIVAACDVTNPLVGPEGAAAVFAPQKGATAEEVDVLARGLDRLATVVQKELGLDVAHLVHGGAGGGLGAGLAAFFAAELVSGFDYVANETGLAGAIDGADVVVTGEGRLDVSTGAGKVVFGVLRLAREAGARPVVVAGEIAPEALPRIGEGTVIASLVERFGRVAITDAAACLTATVKEILSTASHA